MNLTIRQARILQHFSQHCAGCIQMTPTQIGQELFGLSYHSSKICRWLKPLVKEGLMHNSRGLYTITQKGIHAYAAWIRQIEKAILFSMRYGMQGGFIVEGCVTGRLKQNRED